MHFPCVLIFAALAVSCAAGKGPPSSPSEAVNTPLVDQGRKVFHDAGCALCHRREGRGSDQGPDLDRLAEWADPTYVRESILAPRAAIVPGYEKTSMPENYGQILTEAQIDALQYYLSNRLSVP